jgi:hypothetical protein
MGRTWDASRGCLPGSSCRNKQVGHQQEVGDVLRRDGGKGFEITVQDDPNQVSGPWCLHQRRARATLSLHAASAVFVPILHAAATASWKCSWGPTMQGRAKRRMTSKSHPDETFFSMRIPEVLRYLPSVAFCPADSLSPGSSAAGDPNHRLFHRLYCVGVTDILVVPHCRPHRID